jgi:hypothetical protein
MTILNASIKTIIKTIIAYWTALKASRKTLLQSFIIVFICHIILTVGIMKLLGDFRNINFCLVQKYWIEKIKDIPDSFINLNAFAKDIEEINYTCGGETETMYKKIFYMRYKYTAEKQTEMLWNSAKKRFIMLLTPIYLLLIFIIYDCIPHKKHIKKSQKTDNLTRKRPIMKSELNTDPVEKEPKGTEQNLSREQIERLEKLSKKLDAKVKRGE